MNIAWKAGWEKQATRINALSLRERGFLLISVIILVVALVDVLCLSPAQTAHKQVTQRFATQSAELTRLRAELQAAGKPVDASQAVRDEMAELTRRLQTINQEIQVLAPQAQGGPALEQVLVQLLRRHEGLTLLGVATMAQDAPTTPVAGGGPVGGLTQRGLELRVAGPYAELVRYVRALETALPVLRWGTLQLKSEQQPPELQLQVYVLGVPQ